MPTQLRQCYTNEVKSAKDLKITMKGAEIGAYYYPTIPYQMLKGFGDDEKLDMRLKKPYNNN